MMANALSNKFSALFFLLIILGLFISSDSYQFDELANFKYLIVYVITLLVSIIYLYCLLFTGSHNAMILFVGFLPFFVWGESVNLYFINGVFIPYTFLLLGISILFMILRIRPQGMQGESFFWVMVLFFLVLKCFVFFLEVDEFDEGKVHVLINWGLGPLLFTVFMFLCRLSLDKDLFCRSLWLGVKILIISVLMVMVVEMVTRGRWLGLSYILYGAVGSRGGVSGDVTGGLGEPLVLGMATSILSIFLYSESKRKRLLFSFYIIIFCISLRPMLVVFPIALSLIVAELKKLNVFKAIALLIFLSLSFVALWDVLSNKFLGTGGGGVSTLTIFGVDVELGYNFGFYFKNFQWATFMGFDIDPWVQTLTSVLFGGTEGKFFSINGLFFSALILGLSKVSIALIVFNAARTKKQLDAYAMASLFILLVFFCYLDPFQPLFRAPYVQSEVMLGAIPRLSPFYFIFIGFLCFVYGAGHKPLKYTFKVNKNSRGLFR
jgi:hypothetical protein